MSLREPAGVIEHRLLGHGLTSSIIFWLALVDRLTVNLALVPTLTATRAGRDAWLAFLASIPAALAVGWIMAYVTRAAPGEGLARQAQRALGPIGGTLVALAFTWSYLHLTFLLVREYAEVIVTVGLPNTPLVVIVSTVVLVAYVMALQDTPAMARTVLILGPIVILAVVSVLASVAPQADLAILRPVLGGGWSPLASGVLSASIWHSVVYFYPAVSPSIVDHARATRALLGGLICATLLSAALSAEAVAVLGPLGAVRHQFPLYQMARLVMVGELVQRLDLLALAAWGLGLLVGASLHLHAAALCLADLVDLRDHRLLVKSLALLVAVGAMLVGHNVMELREFTDVRTLLPYVALHLWVPTATWALGTRARLKQSSTGRAHDPGEAR